MDLKDPIWAGVFFLLYLFITRVWDAIISKRKQDKDAENNFRDDLMDQLKEEREWRKDMQKQLSEKEVELEKYKKLYLDCYKKVKDD